MRAFVPLLLVLAACPAPEPLVGDDSFETATLLAPVDGVAEVRDTVSRLDERDFFALDVQEGRFYSAWLRPDPEDRDPGQAVLYVYDDPQGPMTYTRAMWLHRARSSGTLTFEVTSEDLAQHAGYLLTFREHDATELEPNDSPADAARQLGTPWTADPFGLDARLALGAVGSPSDRDLFATRVDTALSAGAFCSWALVPGMDTDLTPQLTATAVDGTVLAHTASPDRDDWDGEFQLATGGIALPVPPTRGQLFATVDDTHSTGSPTHAYALLHDCRAAALPYAYPPYDRPYHFATEGQDVALDLQPRVEGDPTVDAGFVGWLDDPTDVDRFSFTGCGRITVRMRGRSVGSGLGDMRITASRGGEAFGGDLQAEPSLLFLNDRCDPITVEVRSETGTFGPDSFYIGSVAAEPP